ncbi:MAG TPA: Xaa-Pro peptidase family protein [Gemmatimonadales bacterium]|nr:Xaa-Pro peptidase family protein [Gemmatimonadales bacterium]
MGSALSRRLRPVLTLVLFALALSARRAVCQAGTFDREEFLARRTRLFEKIGDGVAVVVGGQEHIYNVRFRQAPDFYYLTGLEEPGLVLLLSGPTRTAMVFAPRGNPLRDDSTAASRYGLPIQPLENFFFYFSIASGNESAKKLYLQLTPPDDQLHARVEVRMLQGAQADNPLLSGESPLAEAHRRLARAAPQLPQADLSPLLDELRWVKTPYEIARLREAGRIGARAVAEAMRGTRPGMYEYELAAAAQYVNTRLGARGDGFLPIVPSGPNAPEVHYEKNTRQMKAGELVYMDYGSDYGYYTSDITRVWPVSGKFTPEQEKLYRCVLEARDAIIAAMKPGVTLNQLKQAALPVYQKYGWLDAYNQSGRYIGHFVGISVHDVGWIAGSWLDRPLVAGVVFNVEPIIEFADRGIHLRLEDTVLITENGAENLTAGVPAAVERVLALMKERGVNDAFSPAGASGTR